VIYDIAERGLCQVLEGLERRSAIFVTKYPNENMVMCSARLVSPPGFWIPIAVVHGLIVKTSLDWRHDGC
jgi:hypothetical protein